MKPQRGGTFLGFVLGLVVGLASALAVAVYVTKVPIPFVSKSGSRTPEQDVQEAQRNQNWDPNTPLQGKSPARPAVAASAPALPPPATATPTPATLPAATNTSPASDKKPTSDAAANTKAATPADGKTAAKSDAKEIKPAVTADPIGELLKSKGKTEASSTVEPYTYFVQLGAYRTNEDAEAHRAKLSLAGIETKITEREQSGRMVYRVRVGPFDNREEADKAKTKLDGTGHDTTLVRVQR